MEYNAVIGFSPIILDLTFQAMKDNQEYKSLLKGIGVESGEWFEYQSKVEFESAILKITGKSIDGLCQGNNFSVGSTVIASFAAFNHDIPFEQKLVLIGGDGHSNALLSNYLHKLCSRFKNINIVQGTGYLDICLVLHGMFIPERTMLMLKSIGLETPIDFKDLKNALVFLSAFEIKNNFFAFDSGQLLSTGLDFAINLGDLKVLDSSTIAVISNLIQHNLVKYMFGNEEEFSRFFFASQIKYPESIEGLRRISQSCEVIMFVTLGASGAIVLKGGQTFSGSSKRALNIINTNGAGDAAAGGFLSTHLATSDIPFSLNFAILQAEKVVERSDGILLTG